MAEATSVPETYNIADIWESVADRVPEREALVCGERRCTYGELEERANRLANHLGATGVGPGDFVGCYLTNSIEYMETLLACFKIRAVPVNINYCYVADELLHLFTDSGLVAVVCEPDFVDNIVAIRADVPDLSQILVTREPGDLGRLEGATGYEAALGEASPERPQVEGRGDDDLYVIYTGGTTGLPKGVVWRQGRGRRPRQHVGARAGAGAAGGGRIRRGRLPQDGSGSAQRLVRRPARLSGRRSSGARQKFLAYVAADTSPIAASRSQGRSPDLTAFALLAQGASPRRHTQGTPVSHH